MPETVNGRPQAKVRKDIFENLCAIQCTEQEIAAVLGIDISTLQKWCKKEYGDSFTHVYAEKRLNGKASLRRMQWKHAEKTPAMAIFLGKNYLNQSDSPEKLKAEIELLKEKVKLLQGVTPDTSLMQSLLAAVASDKDITIKADGTAAEATETEEAEKEE